MNQSRAALVLGGTGYVGREVVRVFTREGVAVAFTFFQHEDVARTLEAETGAHSFRTNLAEPNQIRELFGNLDAASFAADILVHSAGIACRAPLLEVTDERTNDLYAVNVRSVLTAVQSFVSRLEGRPAEVILTAAQAGIAKIPASVAFAATQSARLGMNHALAKELGPLGVRVNLVLLGLMDGGISKNIDPRQLSDYQRFSAFSRAGTSIEVAQAILRLALTNQWMTGSILPITGGL